MPSLTRQFPRALVVLDMIVQGQDVGTRADPLPGIVPRKVVLSRHPHTQATTCDVELDGTHIPFDWRSVDAILLSVFLADAPTNEGDGWRTAAARRFVGYVDLGESEQNDDDTITLKARDLSSMLRDTKPVPTVAIPLYTDTLREAINRVLDNVPGGEALSILDGGDLDVSLAPLVGSRHQGEHVYVDRDMTAWAVIEYVCGLANRLVSVDGELLVVRQPRDAYANSAAVSATLAFNTETANLVELKGSKKFVRNRKGIRVVGWDPVSRTRLEADYPPDSALPSTRRPRARRAGGSGHGHAAHAAAPPKPPERDVYTVGGVANLDALKRIAMGIWHERSRQELTIEADTPFFSEPYLSLTNGQRVRLQLNRAIAAGLNAAQPLAVRVAYVERRLQVPRAVAEALVRTAAKPETDLFYVHTATITYGGSESECGIKIELINLIAVETSDGTSGR